MASGMIDSLDSLYRKMCYLRSHACSRHASPAPIGVSWLHPADSSDKGLRKRPTALSELPHRRRVGMCRVRRPECRLRPRPCFCCFILIQSVASTLSSAAAELANDTLSMYLFPVRNKITCMVCFSMGFGGSP